MGAQQCHGLRVRHLGLQAYEPIWQAMSAFTDKRDTTTEDELWLLQHLPVFTQGRAGKPEHLLDRGEIPLVKSDRGGQVTYHGPGQLIVYPLINMRRRNLGVRAMVSLLELTVIDLLERWGLKAYTKAGAPGVYVDGLGDGAEAKIASLGLRVRKGCCFHGVSINVDMDLSPFARINPCGYAGLQMTSMKRQLPAKSFTCGAIENTVIEIIADKLQAAPVIVDDKPPKYS